MKVFVSHSRNELDNIVAAYVCECLKKNKFIPLIDVDDNQIVGRSVVKNVEELLRQSDVLLAILTQNSATSIWVNQEMAYAQALGIPVVHLVIENNYELGGMFRDFNCLKIEKWHDLEHVGDTLKDKIEKVSAIVDSRPPIVIEGNIPRTKRINNFLKETIKDISDRESLRLKIYERAATGTFSLSDKSLKDKDDDYRSLLIEQRDLLQELIDTKRVDYYLQYHSAHRKHVDDSIGDSRQAELKDWIDNQPKESTKTNIHHIEKPHNGPNVLAIENKCVIEGLQKTHGSEYSFSLIWRNPVKVGSYVSTEFISRIFGQSAVPGENL